MNCYDKPLGIGVALSMSCMVTGVSDASFHRRLRDFVPTPGDPIPPIIRENVPEGTPLPPRPPNPVDVITKPDETLKEQAKATERSVRQHVDIARDAAAAIDQGAKDAWKAGQKGIEDTAKAAEKGWSDYINTAKKAGDDIWWNTRKSAGDVVDAGKAVGRFIEREIKSTGDVISAAEQRAREGKFVDAVWHLQTDRAKGTEDNAAKALQESVVLTAVAQTAASTYGGPAGAAAFAAWYTYKQTGDLDQAIRNGIQAGVTSAGYANTSAMPTGTIGEVAKKALVTGAVGGVAVAAAGGNDAAVRDAFIKSGGMVVVQTGQTYITKEYVDPAIAKVDSYCVSAVGTRCSVILPTIQKDEHGNVKVDASGRPQFDNAAVTLPDRKSIGVWQESAQVKAQNAVLGEAEKIVGDKVILSADGKWGVSLDKAALTNQSAKIPAVTLTYTGPGSPFEAKLKEGRGEVSEAINSATGVATRTGVLSPLTSVTWIALENPYYLKPHYERAFGKVSSGPVATGELLKTVNEIRPVIDPANGTVAQSMFKPGTLLLVAEILELPSKNKGVLTWARVEAVE